ncbi:MAG: AMP-binding protein [Solirubrobacterales bacterium]
MRIGTLAIPAALAGRADRLGRVAQNALEVARFGGLETGEEATAYEVTVRRRVYRLRHYLPDPEADGPRPAVVLVPPLMLSADVYDVSPAASAVRILHRCGADPWVVDFGSPEREEGGLERDLADHVVAVSDAVDRVREATGRDVHLAGYSQGGMFCYQAAAYRRNEGIASLVTFGSPVDLRAAAPLGMPENFVAEGAGFVADRVLGGRSVPAWATRTGFALLDPVKSLRQRVEFVMQLHDREALLPRERQRRFLMGEGWVAWPGPALADFTHQFLVHNRMLQGGFTIDGAAVTLADLDRPVLCFVGEVDEIAPAATVRAIRRAAPRAEVHEVSLRAGHFGLVVGGGATATTWPAVAGWARWRDGLGSLPEGIVPMPEESPPDQRGGMAERLGYGLELVAGVGVRAVRGVAATARESVRAVPDLGRQAAAQFPRLGRLQRMEPSTRISLGLLLDERAESAPEEICFLFEDRGHSNAAVKHRIDSVVRGLISLGIRQGEHVGVLMGTRPSALALVAALNRLGAVAVLLRPGGDVAREADLGRVTRIIADPENAPTARQLRAVDAVLLGGGAEPRDPGGLTDLERVDPEKVEAPGWYSPNPGRAGDVAFILFAGEADRTRVNRITNGRWALSAFGTASSAALSEQDTVYSVNPLHHPSGLLLTLGGAVAGGSRLAMARRFDPETFWDEARRYGVTVASYTWTQLRGLLEAPPHPNEAHHPVRLFIGSGMPAGMWRRITERFAPAGIVEFWAATEAGAILANVSGAKPGSVGRPLPGSAEVRVARYDLGAGRLVEGPDGFAVPCGPGEEGILLARGEGMPDGAAELLRGAFERGDSWVSCESLFCRDADGDHWLVDSLATVIDSAAGPVPSLPATNALGALPQVGLAVTYGVPAAGGALVVSAVELLEGGSLAGRDLDEGLAALDPARRPDVVRVVERIPTSSWYRPLTGPLRGEGVPPHSEELPVFGRDGAEGAYVPLLRAERRRLIA